MNEIVVTDLSKMPEEFKYTLNIVTAKKFPEQIQKTIDCLKQGNYARYIRSLISLGASLEQSLPLEMLAELADIKKNILNARSAAEKKLYKIKQIKLNEKIKNFIYCLFEQNTQKFYIQEKILYRLFKKIFQGEGFEKGDFSKPVSENNPDNHAIYNAAKDLNNNTFQHINWALYILDAGFIIKQPDQIELNKLETYLINFYNNKKIIKAKKWSYRFCQYMWEHWYFLAVFFGVPGYKEYINNKKNKNANADKPQLFYQQTNEHADPPNPYFFVENFIQAQHEKIEYAIESYRTPFQKFFYITAEVLGILGGIAYGLTMIASLYLVVHLLPLLITGSILLFFSASYVNWKMLNDPAYEFANALKGKINIFDGLTHFINSYGKVCEMGIERKALLGIAFLLALSVGIAQGAFAFYAVAALIGLGCIACPYIAAFFAGVTVIAFTFLMFKGFVEILQTENPLDVIRKPFENLLKVFDREAVNNKNKSLNRLKAEKIITLVIAIVLAGICIGGLVAISIACKTTMVDVFTKFFHVSAKIAVPFAKAVGWVLSSIGEVPFIIDAAAKFVTITATFCRDYKENVKYILHHEGVIKTFVSLSSIIINAFGNAILSIGPDPINTKLGFFVAFFGAIAEGINNLVGAFENMADDPDERYKKETAQQKIVNSFTKITRAVPVLTIPEFIPQITASPAAEKSVPSTDFWKVLVSQNNIFAAAPAGFEPGFLENSFTV